MKGLIAIAGKGGEQHLRRITKALCPAFINLDIPDWPHPFQQIRGTVQHQLFRTFDIHLDDIDAVKLPVCQKIIQPLRRDGFRQRVAVGCRANIGQTDPQRP